MLCKTDKWLVLLAGYEQQSSTLSQPHSGKLHHGLAPDVIERVVQ